MLARVAPIVSSTSFGSGAASARRAAS